MKALCLAVICAAVSTAYAAERAVELPPAVVEAFESYTALPDTLVPVLQQARDQSSAKTAAPALKQVLTHIYETREKLHKMPRLTPGQNQEVRLRYAQQMREEWGRLYAEIVRIRDARCFQSVEFAQAFRLMCMMIEK